MIEWLPLATQALGTLGKSGGLKGLLGGGGETKVTQSVAQSSSNVAILSLTNTVGPGSSLGGSLPAINSNPVATSTATTPASPSPVFGQTFGPDYEPGNLAATSPEPLQAGFSPLLVMGVIGFIGYMLLSGGDD